MGVKDGGEPGIVQSLTRLTLRHPLRRRRSIAAPGLLLFHEYFHGEAGRGLGASHQTGWTALLRKAGARLQPLNTS